MSMAAALAPARCRAKLASASGRARADETQPRRDLDRLRAPGGAELRCGVAQVETHRRYRQRQDGADLAVGLARRRSEEHTSELQSLMRISYAVFCLKKTRKTQSATTILPQN